MAAEPATPWPFDWPDARTRAYAQLERSRLTIEATRACLRSAKDRLGASGRPRPPAPTGPEKARPVAAVSRVRPIHLDAWLELSDGSPECDDEVRQAVNEIVQLQFLLIEGLCRHFPGIATAIRDVARHLFEDAANLTNPACCEGATSVAPRPFPERVN